MYVAADSTAGWGVGNLDLGLLAWVFGGRHGGAFSAFHPVSHVEKSKTEHYLPSQERSEPDTRTRTEAEPVQPDREVAQSRAVAYPRRDSSREMTKTPSCTAFRSIASLPQGQYEQQVPHFQERLQNHDFTAP